MGHETDIRYPAQVLHQPLLDMFCGVRNHRLAPHPLQGLLHTVFDNIGVEYEQHVRRVHQIFYILAVPPGSVEVLVVDVVPYHVPELIIVVPENVPQQEPGYVYAFVYVTVAIGDFCHVQTNVYQLHDDMSKENRFIPKTCNDIRKKVIGQYLFDVLDILIFHKVSNVSQTVLYRAIFRTMDNTGIKEIEVCVVILNIDIIQDVFQDFFVGLYTESAKEYKQWDFL